MKCFNGLVLGTMILAANSGFSKVFNTNIQITKAVEIVSSKKIAMSGDYLVTIKFTGKMPACSNYEGMLLLSHANYSPVFKALATYAPQNDPKEPTCEPGFDEKVITDDLILMISPKVTMVTINDEIYPMAVKNGSVVILNEPDTVVCPLGIGVNGSTGLFMSCQCPGGYPHYNAATGLCQDLAVK